MIDNRFNIFHLMKQENKLEKLLIYNAISTIVNPYEKTKEVTYMNPLPIYGMIRQISTESLKWKYDGKIPALSIEVICELKYESLFRTAKKIEYDGQYYHTMVDDAKNFMILKKSDYLVVILGYSND